MKNLEEILESVSLTEKELEMIKALSLRLSGNFGECYSDTDCRDLADILNWDVGVAKGVLGSLVKKGIVEEEELENFPSTVISFVGQDKMCYVDISHFESFPWNVDTIKNYNKLCIRESS